MNSEILIRARTNDTGTRLKGYPVAVQAEGWPWGACEGLPNHVLLRVLDTAVEQIQEYVQAWMRNTTYEVLAHDPAQDFFRVRIFADPASIGNKEDKDVSANQMRDFLVSWGAKQIQDADNKGGVTFELTAMDALNAPGYITWGREDDYINFKELSYLPAEGIHRVEMDYSSSAMNKPKAVEGVLRRSRCDIVSHDTDRALLVFEAKRDVMVRFLERSVRDGFNEMLGRATYYFTEAFVDSIIKAGGKKDISFADFNKQIKDIRIA